MARPPCRVAARRRVARRPHSEEAALAGGARQLRLAMRDRTMAPALPGVWPGAGGAARDQRRPGAASMFGLLAELGPLLLNEDSLSTPDFKRTGVPTLFSNPHAWTRLGSVVMFDCPPPVGFSYCADPSGTVRRLGRKRTATVQVTHLCRVEARRADYSSQAM